MSTTHCGTNIVRIRVDLFNDILRFDYVLQTFFFLNFKTHHFVRFNPSDWRGLRERERERERKKKKNKRKKRKKKEKLKVKKKKNRLGRVE